MLEKRFHSLLLPVHVGTPPMSKFCKCTVALPHKFHSLFVPVHFGSRQAGCYGSGGPLTPGCKKEHELPNLHVDVM